MGGKAADKDKGATADKDEDNKVGRTRLRERKQGRERDKYRVARTRIEETMVRNANGGTI